MNAVIYTPPHTCKRTLNDKHVSYKPRLMILNVQNDVKKYRKFRSDCCMLCQQFLVFFLVEILCLWRPFCADVSESPRVCGG